MLKKKIFLKKKLEIIFLLCQQDIFTFTFYFEDNESLLSLIHEESKLNHKEKSKVNIINNNIDFEFYDYSNIKNMNDLNNLVEILLNTFNSNDYELERHIYLL